MLSHLRTAARALLFFTILTGVLYPAVVTGAAAVLFPGRAAGSPARVGDRVVGSRLVGQSFRQPKYFWSRPSATSPAYNAAASSGSNLGPSNPALREAVVARVAALRASDPDNEAPIPVDLVTASASGLDPHVSVAGALWQVPRVARARGLPEERVRALVEARVEPRDLGILGAPRVNVLALNLALDALR